MSLFVTELPNTIRNIVLLGLLIATHLRAETINGNCQILQQPFGDELFSVGPGTEVDCSPANKGWCYIYTKVWVEKKMVYDGQQVLANAKLKNNKGKLLGRSKISFTPNQTLTENDTAYLLELSGYVEVSCIEDTSVVEHDLEMLIGNFDSLPDQNLLSKHLNRFSYEAWVTANGFESYLLPDKSFGAQPAGIRTAIVCENNKVIAIIHGRKLQLKKYENHLQESRVGIYFLAGGKETYKKRFQLTFQAEIEKALNR
ncbi:MAG: hypothetical protein ACK4XL_05180 [Bacteroidota bacterium]